MKKNICTILLCCLLPLSLAAGSGDDFGTWTAVNLTAGITDKIKAQLWLETRTKDECSAVDCFDIMPSVGFSVLPFLEVGLGAEFVDARIRKDIGFRPYASLNLSSGPLSFSLREMPFIEVYNDETPTSFSLRSSIKASYTIPSTRVKPYVNIEVFTKQHWDKTRHYAGVDIGFGKRSSLDVYYMYYSFAGKDWQRHLLGITYNLKLF